MVVNTKLQDQFLELFFSSAVAEDFYLTGGTALARFYFHHRESVDLDLFTNNQEVDFDQVSAIMRGIVHRSQLKVVKTIVTDTFIQYITEGSKEKNLKVDIVKDTPVRFGEIVVKGKLRLDSVENIGSNKIAAIFGRTDGKDFVDLYMILKRTKLTFDHLYAQAKRKDLGLSEFYLAEALAAVNKVELFPKVTPLIDEKELKAFYTGLSHRLLMKIKPEE